jgi:hypothetical protein
MDAVFPHRGKTFSTAWKTRQNRDMNTRRAAWILGMAGTAWAAALAQTVDPPPVLTVLGASYTARELRLPEKVTDCRGVEALLAAVLGPLFAAYQEQAGISVTEDDLKDYCRRQLPEDGVFLEAWAEWKPGGTQWRARQEAAMLLTVWKLQRALFDQYGGRVTRGEWIPPQAFDAMVQHVAERSDAGDFIIHDDFLRLQFWECLRSPKDILVPAEEGRILLDEHPAGRGKRN